MATNTLHIPSALKLSGLKTLAAKCGLQTTGTKPVLINRLYHELTSTPPLSQEKRTTILSIDMGIRNLAYCILDVPSVSFKALKSSGAKDTSKRRNDLPTLQAWHRLAVSTAPKAETSSGAPTAKEAFDPATLSKIAYALLRHRLLLLNPDVILIERQRFRSMGSKHILEWTIRVNMFESILYATLNTLGEEGLWEGRVIPITPGKVGPFWVGEESDFLDEGEKVAGKKKIRTSKSAKVRNKGAKIDLVRGWCGTGEMVGWGNEEVEGMVKRYGEKWERKPGGVKGVRLKKVVGVADEADEKMGKLDDLADCLLQGMAWLEWEKNKRLALEYGVEALLDPV